MSVDGAGAAPTGVIRGYRYARAARFRLPVVAPWGVQIPITPAPQPGVRTNEDCLHLTVRSPVTADGAPVLVWIHGGAHMEGSVLDPLTDGTRFAESQGVVVVAVQYRLGALGHLALGGSVAGDEDAGNLALHDQLAALRWVQKNIHRLGGDPGRVTVMGQSAGGVDALALLASGAGRGLFHAVIAHSCTAERAASAGQATTVRKQLAAYTGVVSAADLVRLPIERIMDAQARLVRHRSQRAVVDSLPFRPVVDGRLLNSSPLDALAGGVGAEIPLLIGTSRREALSWVGAEVTDPRALVRLLEAVAPGAAFDAVVDAARRDRGWATSIVEIYEAVLSELLYRSPTSRIVSARSGALTYEFVFDPSGVEGVASGHSGELPMLFGGRPVPQAAAALSARMVDCWGAFVREGRPSTEPTWRAAPAGLFEWGRDPTFRGQSDPHLRALLAAAGTTLDRW